MEFGAPLYRLALTAFLSLSYDLPTPSATDPQALGVYMSERLKFNGTQQSADKALLTAR